MSLITMQTRQISNYNQREYTNLNEMYTNKI